MSGDFQTWSIGTVSEAGRIRNGPDFKWDSRFNGAARKTLSNIANTRSARNLPARRTVLFSASSLDWFCICRLTTEAQIERRDHAKLVLMSTTGYPGLAGPGQNWMSRLGREAGNWVTRCPPAGHVQ